MNLDSIDATFDANVAIYTIASLLETVSALNSKDQLKTYDNYWIDLSGVISINILNSHFAVVG